LIVSPDGQDGSVRIHQDVRIYSCILNPDPAGENLQLSHRMAPGRAAWLQVIRGSLELVPVDNGKGTKLQAGDGSSIESEGESEGEIQLLSDGETAEFILFDLP